MKKLIGFISCVITLTLCIGTMIFWNATANDKARDGETAITTPLDNKHWLEEDGFYTTTYAGSGTKDDPYKISTAEELAGLAYTVNSGDTSVIGRYFLQTEDIDLSAHYWVPIGLPYEFDLNDSNNLTGLIDSITVSFQGYFDGNNKTISHLIMPSPDNDSVNYPSDVNITGLAFGGLFGFVQDSVIENVNVAYPYIPAVVYAGSVIGFARHAIIQNCSTKSGGLEDYVVTGYFGTGGIVGGCDDFVRIYNCSNSISTIGTLYAGGILGFSMGELELKDCENTGSVTGALSAGIGGIVGAAVKNDVMTQNFNFAYSSNIKIHNCVNYGTILPTLLSYYLGGIVGLSQGDVYYCRNYGIIKYINLENNSIFNSAAKFGVGGIAGIAVKIRSCSNEGTFDIQIDRSNSKINDEAYAAGIAYYAKEIRDCYNRADISTHYVRGITFESNSNVRPENMPSDSDSKVYNCYNTGKLTGELSNSTVQGVGGKEVVNSFNLGQVTGTGTLYAVTSGSSTNAVYDRSVCSANANGANGVYSFSSTAKYSSTYTGTSYFNSENPWKMNGEVWDLNSQVNNGYPSLVYHAEPNDNSQIIVLSGYWDEDYDMNFEGQGTAASPYLIKTPQQLAGLYQYVKTNQNLNFETEDMNEMIKYPHFALDNDIDMSGKYWKSIGGMAEDEMSMFTGTFDGRNHTITGLFMKKGDLVRTGRQSGGLFGITYGATIKNVTIKNSELIGAGIVYMVWQGYVDTLITNCHNYANVISGGDQDAYGAAGGIVSILFDMNNGSEPNLKGVTIEGCSNHGKISVSMGSTFSYDVPAAGGIVGRNNYPYDAEDTENILVIKHCYNEGPIESDYIAAGIMAYAEKLTLVTDCYNRGTINGAYIAAGAGYGLAIFNHFFNLGNVVSEQGYAYGGGMISINSFNIGKVSGAGGSYAIGDTQVNCYFTGDYPDEEYGAIKLDNLETLAKTRSWYEDSSNWPSEGELIEEIQTGFGTEISDWDMNDGWRFNKFINDGYPNLVMMNGWWTSVGNYNCAFEGLGTEFYPFLIDSEEKLAGIGVMVADGVSYEGKYFALTKDLDMSQYLWMTIGDDEHPFRGNISGKYQGVTHKISGLRGYDYSLTGLFAYTDGSIISDIVLESSNMFMGGIVAEAVNTQFINCTNYADVSMNQAYDRAVGGIVGKLSGENSKIENCTNYGKITGFYAGGIAGYVVSSAPTLQILNCRNEGDVYGYGDPIRVGSSNYQSYYACVGGIVGYAEQDEEFVSGMPYVLIDGCVNTGKLDGEFGGDFSYTQNGSTSTTGVNGLGGILGKASVGLTISNCQNEGRVMKAGGGILGYVHNKVYNTTLDYDNFITINIENCKNLADVGVEGRNHSGGIFGGTIYYANVNIFYCSNSGNVFGSDVGGISGGCYGSPSRHLSIKFCWNEGDVTASGSNNSGAAAGITTDYYGAEYIFGCYNVGDITSSGSVYGIANVRTAINCYNAGKIETSSNYLMAVSVVDGFAINCFNIGECVSSSGSVIAASPINSYYGGACTNNQEDNGIALKNDNDVKDLNWYKDMSNWAGMSVWDFDRIWQLDANVNNGLPTLRINNFEDFFWINEEYVNTDWKGTGEENDPYLIETPEDFAGITYLSQQGETFEGKHFLQTSNLDMSGKIWTPIGIISDSVAVMFSGVYDGGNYTISGIETVGNEQVSALFGVIGNATIQNLNLQDSAFRGMMCAGSIVGGISMGDVNATINNVRTTAEVYSFMLSGGIVAMVDSSNAVVTNAIFDGKAYAYSTEESIVGGIVGEVAYSDIVIKNCMAAGELSGMGVGGIVAYLFSEDDTTALVANCTVSSKIYSTMIAGSLVGYISNGRIENCMSTAEFVALSEEVMFGGFAANCENSIIYNCSYFGSNPIVYPFTLGNENSEIISSFAIIEGAGAGYYSMNGLFDEGWVFNLATGLPIQAVLLYNGAYLPQASNVLDFFIEKGFTALE